jgi:hypothetical protein
VNQYRVRRGSVEGCDAAHLRMERGSVRVQCGSVQCAAWLSKVPSGSVPGAAKFSSGCSVAQLGCGVPQYRVWRGSVEGCGVAQLKGCSVAQ